MIFGREKNKEAFSRVKWFHDDVGKLIFFAHLITVADGCTGRVVNVTEWEFSKQLIKINL